MRRSVQAASQTENIFLSEMKGLITLIVCLTPSISLKNFNRNRSSGGALYFVECCHLVLLSLTRPALQQEVDHVPAPVVGGHVEGGGAATVPRPHLAGRNLSQHQGWN